MIVERDGLCVFIDRHRPLHSIIITRINNNTFTPAAIMRVTVVPKALPQQTVRTIPQVAVEM